MKIGYARVSTDEQELGLQITSLKQVGCSIIFTEKISAVKQRPELDKALTSLRGGDTFVVWKLDRLARSLGQLIQILEDLRIRDINLISISDFINTSNKAHSTLYTQIIGAFAQFEREIMIERTKAGLADARRRGVVLGRKPGLSEESKMKAEAAKKLYEENMPVLNICKIINVSRGTFYKYLNYLGVPLHTNSGRKRKN